VRDPRSILISGASSGIGEALALAYAGPGVHLALTGRNAARLEAVAGTCRDQGADLVIANAGISAGTGGLGETAEQTRNIMAVNLEGVMNTVLPVLPGLRARRRGQDEIVSSLAGFHGIPGAPAYCASKAAVKVWGEALRGHLAPEGIGVTVVCPGFVVSRMTAVNKFPMPLLMEVERAAAIIKRGLARNKARIVFPRRLAAAVWLLAALPPAVTDPLLRRMPKKG
jgi:short-subunit dehydrogenase